MRQAHSEIKGCVPYSACTPTPLPRVPAQGTMARPASCAYEDIKMQYKVDSHRIQNSLCTYSPIYFDPCFLFSHACETSLVAPPCHPALLRARSPESHGASRTLSLSLSSYVRAYPPLSSSESSQEVMEATAKSATYVQYRRRRRRQDFPNAPPPSLPSPRSPFTF